MNKHTENINHNQFIEVIKNENTCKKILKYLTKKDEENMIVLNKEIYNLLSKKTFQHYKYLTKELNDEFIFYNKFKIEIKNLPILKVILKESDKLFSSVYKQSQCMIIIFYFSFLFLGIDLFFFFLIIGKDKKNEKIKWYSQIPLMFLWVEILFIMIIYFIKIKKVVYQITEQIKKKIPQLNGKGIKYLKRKIIYRINNLQPLSFWYISFCYLCFYLPTLIKILFESLNTSYEKAYISMAWIIFIFYYIFDFAKLVYYMIKHYKTKIDIYQIIYHKGKSNFFKKKLFNIRIKEKRVFLSEFMLAFFSYSIKIFLFIILLTYLKHLGRKFDNIKYRVKWTTLCIPLYIIILVIIFWGILYIYSIRFYETKNKMILYITIILVILSSCFLSIALPLILDERWKLNYIFPVLGTLILTISIIIHFIIMKKIYSNQNYNIYINCINNNNNQQEIISERKFNKELTEQNLN